MKCRHCGAVNARPAPKCWLCGQDPSGEPEAVAAAPPPVHTAAINPAQKYVQQAREGFADNQVHTAAINPAQKYSRSFTLATIFLVMTLIAVCMGVVVMSPGLGIVLAILSLPAFVRTGLRVQRRVALGKSVTTGQKIGWFLGSLAAAVVVAVVVVTVAAVGMFFVCLSAGPIHVG